MRFEAAFVAMNGDSDQRPEKDTGLQAGVSEAVSILGFIGHQSSKMCDFPSSPSGQGAGVSSWF